MTTTQNTWQADDFEWVLDRFISESFHNYAPVVDQQGGLEISLTSDDRALAEAPQAHAAYVGHRRNFAA